MKRLSVLAVLAAVAALGAAQAGAFVELHVDLGASWSTVGPAAGYTLLSDPNTNNFGSGTAVSLGNGASVGYVHTMTNAWDYRDRGGANTLLRDFVMTSNSSVQDPIEVRGLTPGDYTLTLYSNDNWYDHTANFDIDQNHDGLFDQTVTIQNPGAKQKTVAVSVSAAGILQLGLKSPNNGVWNGFDLVATPEPATMLLLVGGLAVGAIRRRVQA